MVLGFQVLNETRRSPNERINFIKPLEGPDKAIAMDFLERIAAMMNPIMKEHSLVVMSLDEFPPNREFWGRNFNNGACIQLVLKDLAGQWLSFRHVLGVMIHELAHNTHMNHSRHFHALRNVYQVKLDGLRAKGYTGEGFWSTGRTLLSGQYVRDKPLAQEFVPEHLCGGTYREPKAREKKGKRKLTYKEQQQRRKERKFGLSEGNKVGGDDDERRRLEGKDVKAPPKIAKSKRGRELRAAAALKRFEEQKKEGVKGEIKDEEWEELGDTASEDEDDKEDTVDVGGHRMVPVSGASDSIDDERALEDEMFELTGCSIVSSNIKTGKTNEQIFKSEKKPERKPKSEPTAKKKEPEVKKEEPRKYAMPAPPSSRLTVIPRPPPPSAPTSKPAAPVKKAPAKTTTKKSKAKGGSLLSSSGGRTLGDPSKPPTSLLPPTPVLNKTTNCPVCTTENHKDSLCCMVCNCVLRLDLVRDTWRCQSAACKGGNYINSGDYGVCGVCGSRKS